MAWGRSGLAVLVAVAVAGLAVSGGSGGDPRTPEGLPGLPAPFLGTAVAGGGALTAAVDAYGDVVDLRPSPAGQALIENPAARQAAGTVPAATGIVPRVSFGGGPQLPLWRADAVSQRYLPGTNVVRTRARFAGGRVVVTVAAVGSELAVVARPAGARARASLSVHADGEGWTLCRRGCGRLIAAAVRDDRAWLARGRPLGSGAPAWARRMYARSLLTLRALTDARTGAVAAGARDGWAYVWPRDAATAALALRAAGYRQEARRVAGFLSRLDLAAAARFGGGGAPVPERGPQGDAPGWVRAAARATGASPLAAPAGPGAWGDAPDYQEGGAGDYLGNAIAAEAALNPFDTPAGLVRRAGDPASGLDSAAAWAVEPFSRPAAFTAARRTLLSLLRGATPYGITPGEGWSGGVDPWTAPTAWSAWALAALAGAEAVTAPRRARADRGAALRLLSDLRRAATPAGSLPERVDARSGIPRSTTPLAWPHAFAALTLLRLWPSACEDCAAVRESFSPHRGKKLAPTLR
ncbi:MAG: glycoside hydrolase family 15 protein [Syntrophothermus sp.]